MKSKDEEKYKILYISFNQDRSCLALGLEIGFAIYSVNPMKKLFLRGKYTYIIIYIDFGCGIGRIEMLKTTNILALVGGGNNPKFSPNKIIIWDESKCQIIGELRFNTNVLNVKIKMDRIVGVCQKRIYIFNINTLAIVDMFDTYENNHGIISISDGDLISVIAFPYDEKGIVKLVNFNSLAQPPIISAHESNIACLSINYNGTLLATASDKGTLIRVFNISNGKLIIELRRGSKNAEIHNIVFDKHNKFVGCTGDSGTIHIFSIISAMKNLDENYYSNELEEESKNKKSIFNKILNKINSAYLNSEWSFAKFRISEHNCNMSFLKNHTICVFTLDGKYYLASFDPKKIGECEKLKESYIF